LDQWLTNRLPDLSRSRIQALIRDGAVLVDGVAARANHKVRRGQTVSIELPPPAEPEPLPEAIPLDVVFEDSDIIVVNKPAGMVTHPAPGHSGGTLVNALLHHCQDLSGIGGVKRPGIVHRLDADTTGLLVAAKNDAAHQALASAMEAREISREYVAVIAGSPKESSGAIDAPIGRSRNDRTRMSINGVAARRAVTHWEVEIWGEGISVLRVRLETGRTHQIRVHLASRMMPVIGDRVYGWTTKREMELIPHRDATLIQALSRVERQMLHARTLRLRHPRTGQPLELHAPIPADMAALTMAITPVPTQRQLEQQAEMNSASGDSSPDIPPDAM